MLRPLAMAVMVILLEAPALSGQITRIKVSSDLDYAAFAAAVAPRLAEIEDKFQGDRQRLEEEVARRGMPYLTKEEVEAFVSRTEAEVLATLEPKEPGLAPLRDSIRLRFQRIRQKLASVEPARSSGFAFASFQPAQSSPDLLPPHLAETLFDEARAVLQRVVKLAGESRFSLRLCVVSRPDPGATFRMRPPEYREGVKSGKTVLDFPEAALGRYFYKVESRKRKLQPIQCGWESGGQDDQCLDLWDSAGDQLFTCDFAEGSCELPDLPPGGCPAS